MPSRPPFVSARSKAPPLRSKAGPGWDHGGRTRQQRGYGKEHQAIRQELLNTVIFCEECDRRGRNPRRLGEIADHIVPLAKGGTGDRSNYQLLCRSCAANKDAFDRGKTRKRAIGIDGYPLED